MTIENMIKCCGNLTPTENQLAQYILKNKEEIQSLYIQEVAEKTFTSKSAIHRFCKKIGLDGFNDLKVRLAKDILEENKNNHEIDANFPFQNVDDEATIAEKLLNLYEVSIRDTYNSIDINILKRSAKLLNNANVIDVYTHAHNMNIAENFKDKMLGIGRVVNCPKSAYEQRCMAAASNKNHVAIILSYSGKATFLEPVVDILRKNKVDIILVGRLGNGNSVNYTNNHLYISDRENLKNRISQFSSHIAMQYILDIVFSCIFKLDYEKNIDYIKNVINYIDEE